MIRPTIEETWTLLFMALATLLIVTTGNIVTITAATAGVTTKTQLKTYTDPAGFFTLQYPADWTVNHTQPVTKFDRPSVIFITHHPRSVVSIEIKPSPFNSPMEFRDASYRYVSSHVHFQECKYFLISELTFR